MSRSKRVVDVGVRRAWSVGEAAGLLGLSYDKVLALINADELGARSVGKRWVIPDEEITRFLAPAMKSA